MRFEMLYGLYPNARFVLTERPFESWRESLETYFSWRWGTANFTTLRQDAMKGEQSSHGEDIGRVHCALYFSHPGPREAYEAFEQRVERFFADKPANKLLRHDVFRGDGWPKLCSFVGAPEPEEPYPRLNAG
jgi:hypothetical protein